MARASNQAAARRADTGAALWHHTFQLDENAALSMFERPLHDTIEHSVASAIHLAERRPAASSSDLARRSVDHEADRAGARAGG